MSYKRYAAGVGLGTLGLLIGFVCLGKAVETTLDRKASRSQKRETTAVGLLLGVPTTVGALSLLTTAERKRRTEYSARLQTLFYKAIRANDGKINAIQFAMLAEISLAQAHECLNAWAVPMNAKFDIDEAGVVVYCFPISRV